MKDFAREDMLIVVLSRNYSTGLGVVRSLGAAGYPVDLLASAYKKGVSRVAAASKYVGRVVEVVSSKAESGNDEDFLATILTYAEEGKKTILFPTDDYTTSVVDANRSRLEPYFLFPHLEQGSALEYMNKARQRELAAEAGLSVPMEWVVSLQDPSIPKDVPYPCFLKPISSLSGYKTEMGICNNEEALKKKLAKLQKQNANRSVLVQEYLPIEKEVDFSAVCNGSDVVVPALIKKDHIAAYETGVTLAGTMVPTDTMISVVEKAKNMLASYGYIGMVDVELNYANGTWYFGEVNLRSGGPNYAYFKSGVNLPELTVKALLGEPLPQHLLPKTYVSFVNEKVAWEDIAHHRLSFADWKRLCQKSKVGLLQEPKDPKPYALFLRSLPMLVLRGTLRTMLDCREAKPDTVWVVGRNYDSNLGIARALSNAGYKVNVLRVFDTNLVGAVKQWILLPHADACSNAVASFSMCLTNKDPNKLYEKLKQLRTAEKQLLIPTDDFVAGVVDSHYNELSAHFYLPNVANREGDLVRLMNKEYQKQLATSFGLPVVKGTAVTVKRETEPLPDTISYPCFLKPNVSKDAPKSMMSVCVTEEALKAALAQLEPNTSVLIEDFISIKKEYSFLGVCVAGKTSMPALFVSEQMGEGSRRGVALTGTTLPPDTLPEQPLLQEMMSSLSYTGLFDIDLIEAENGQRYFTELNLRPGGSVSAFTASGINLPGRYAEARVRALPKRAEESVRAGQTFVSERGLLEEYARGTLSLKQVRKELTQADIHFIKNKKDPWPYRQWKAKFLPALLLKLSK